MPGSGVRCRVWEAFSRHACVQGTRLEDGSPKHVFTATRAPWAAGAGAGRRGQGRPCLPLAWTDLSDRFCCQSESGASAP